MDDIPSYKALDLKSASRRLRRILMTFFCIMTVFLSALLLYGFLDMNSLIPLEVFGLVALVFVVLVGAVACVMILKIKKQLRENQQPGRLEFYIPTKFTNRDELQQAFNDFLTRAGYVLANYNNEVVYYKISDSPTSIDELALGTKAAYYVKPVFDDKHNIRMSCWLIGSGAQEYVVGDYALCEPFVVDLDNIAAYFDV